MSPRRFVKDHHHSDEGGTARGRAEQSRAMAAQQRLASSEELQRAVSIGLRSQLELLQEARKSHSHSDLLLPPDSVSSILEPGSLSLKAHLDVYIESSSEEQKQRDDIRKILAGNASIFAFEAKRLVLDALKDSKGQHNVGRSETKDLFDRLDVALDLEVHGESLRIESRGGQYIHTYCKPFADLLDGTVPLSIIEEVLEQLTITSCSLHFTYIETRVHELTRNLHPAKGKGLVLLRLCNELIRRLSRPTREHTVFVGRVLSLLSSVFPLGERSGVNFRGDFNVDNKTTWDEVAIEEEEYSPEAESPEDEEKSKETEIADSIKESADAGKDKPSDEDLLKSIQDPTFYALFWQMQAWFANPNLLFALKADESIALPKGVADPIPGGSPSMMRTFRISTKHVLDVFGAVGRREKELEGKADNTKQENDLQARHPNGVTELPDAGQQVDEVSRKKRKTDNVKGEPDEDVEQEKDTESFFPKYLTGRNLFEYELRDATFRRHVLAQYLVVFQYLLSFTQIQKDKRVDWKNPSLIASQPDYILDEADERWISDTWKRVVSLLRGIEPQGRVFADTILQVLKREARWIDWKSSNCPPIDRAPQSDEQLIAFTKARRAVSVRMRNYPHTVGTAALSRLWEDGVRKPEPAMRTIENEEGMEIQIQTDGLDDMEFAPVIPTLESYATQIAKIEKQQEERRKELEWASPCVYPIVSLIPSDQRQQEAERIAREVKDKKLSELEQVRVLHAWRGARLARSTHLGSFSRIKMDDGKTMGMRMDDVTRLMKAIEDREKKSEQANSVGGSQALQQPPAPSSLPASVAGVSVPASPASTNKEADVEMGDAAADVPVVESDDKEAEAQVKQNDSPVDANDVPVKQEDEDTSMQS
jgi:THO complex subunit 1